LQKRNDAVVQPSAENIGTFVEVVRQQSLSAAARRLELPKSTVSRRLLRLEQQLSTKLVHRQARRIALTPAGRRFYEAVYGAVDALDAAVTAAEQSSREPRGAVRLTAPPDLGRMVLAPMFVAFLERYPEITLELVLTNRMLDLAQEGVDLAVRAGRVLEPTLIARKLCTSELQLAASAAHAGSSSEDDPRALAQRPFVLYRSAGRQQTIRLERGAGKRRQSLELEVSGRVSVDDYAALAELVAAGQGVGLLPSIHLQEGVQAGRLVRLLPEWASRSANIYLVYPSRQQPERARLLAEFLLSSFASIARV
jgi:DNA-binding transcriptional LysR family regulator